MHRWGRSRYRDRGRKSKGRSREIDWFGPREQKRPGRRVIEDWSLMSELLCGYTNIIRARRVLIFGTTSIIIIPFYFTLKVKIRHRKRKHTTPGFLLTSNALDNLSKHTQHHHEQRWHARCHHPTATRHHLCHPTPNRVSNACPTRTNTGHLVAIIFPTETIPIHKQIVWISFRTRVADTVNFLSTFSSTNPCKSFESRSKYKARRGCVFHSMVLKLIGRVIYNYIGNNNWIEVVSYLGCTVSLQWQSWRLSQRSLSTAWSFRIQAVV